MRCSWAMCALSLATVTAASSADAVVEQPIGTIPGVVKEEEEEKVTERTATFHGTGISGKLTFRQGVRASGVGVEWHSDEIHIPEALVVDVCGAIPEYTTFAYSVNEKWMIPILDWGVRDTCGDGFTGGHWDPTAACSLHSSNWACLECGTRNGYQCSPESFQGKPDGMGDFAYRFLNKDACELGDLSGMSGELAAISVGTTVRIPAGLQGFAQMSAPFGEITLPSVASEGTGLNCDSSGPPAAHSTNCGCIEYNGKHSPSIGTISVFTPPDHELFYNAGRDLVQLKGRSVVVYCGSTFANAGKPLMCTKVY